MVVTLLRYQTSPGTPMSHGSSAPLVKITSCRLVYICQRKVNHDVLHYKIIKIIIHCLKETILWHVNFYMGMYPYDFVFIIICCFRCGRWQKTSIMMKNQKLQHQSWNLEHHKCDWWVYISGVNNSVGGHCLDHGLFEQHFLIKIFFFFFFKWKHYIFMDIMAISFVVWSCLLSFLIICKTCTSIDIQSIINNNDLSKP